MIIHFRLLKDVNMRLWWNEIVDVLEWERVQLYLQLDGWNRMLSSAIGVVERRLGMCLIALFLVFCIVISTSKSFIFILFYFEFCGFEID